MPLLSIIIPVYNEGKTVETILHKIDILELPKGFKTEVLVVNDGSNDETKRVIENFITNKPNFSKFKSLPSNVDLDELNTARTPSAIKSENLVFTEVDSNDDNLFNEILWKGIKGEDAILPAPRRVGFVFNAGNKKD
jgi:glycosyltransferase involved in cell wall biosynthesis